jgi:hypothetical protein
MKDVVVVKIRVMLTSVLSLRALVKDLKEKIIYKFYVNKVPL